MDALVYLDEFELNDQERPFCGISSLLAIFSAVEGIGGVPPSVEHDITESLGFDDEEFDQLASVLAWRRGSGGNILDIAKRYLSANSQLLVRHCVDILGDATRLLHRMGMGEIDSRGIQALQHIFLATPVSPNEVVKIVAHHLAAIEQQAESGEGNEREEGDE